MHCLVAVARCRVQTRRYHCLINHIQSHRPTLCHLPPFPFTVPYPSRPTFLALIIPLADPQRRRAVSSPFSFPAFPQLHCFALSGGTTPRQHHRPQLTLIYVIFSGRPHVTALRRTVEQRVLDVRAGYQGMRFADARASEHGKRERETRQKYRVTEPRWMVIRGHPVRRYSER